jgi:DNA-binding transcriptional ArsR family regulator
MKVQNRSAILSDSPARLLDRSLEEYGGILRQKGELGPEHLEKVDYALRHTVVRLLVRNAGEEELEEVYGDLRALVPLDREEELQPWSLRWRGFADLVDARLATLAGRNPDHARRLAHAPQILRILEGSPGLTQVELGDAMGLKPANLSRILSILEGHDLIHRRKVGREKRVFLSGESTPTASQEPSLNRSAMKPFRDYLRLAS